MKIGKIIATDFAMDFATNILLQLSKVYKDNICCNVVANLQRNCNRITTTYFATTQCGCKSVAKLQRND